MWKHDKYQESQAPRVGGGGNPNKKVTINLSNLHPTKVFSADLEVHHSLFGLLPICENSKLGSSAVCLLCP